MAISESDIAAQLIERLLTDPAFRARFRRDPAGACREAGLDDLAQEMSLGSGNAMMTLDVRESKSSLAGVMMAAAMEGVGVFEFTKHVAPALGDLSNPLGDVLSRVNLPAIPGRGALGGGGGAAPATPVEKEAPEPVAAAASAPAAPAPPEPPAEKAESGGDIPGVTGPAEPDPAAAAAAKIAEAEKPPSAEEKAAVAVAAIAEEEEPDLPSATALPEGGVASAELDAEENENDFGAAPEAPPAAEAPAAQPQAAAAAPPEAVERPKPDPDLYGQDGPGSAMTPEIKALLENPKVKFDDVGVADLKAGKIDPRVVAALTKLSQDHEITVTCMCSDHAKMSASGNVSNHAYGRGVDIGTIDGELVRPGSPAARELASAMSELDPDYRPNEIGSPFAIAGPGYFTDAAHQDHIHFGFKEPITPDWEPPPDVAATAGAPVAQAAGVAPAPAVPAGDSGTFQAVTAETAARQQQTAFDSGTFLAVQPVVGPPSAVADPRAVPSAVFDAAANASSGSSGIGAKALEIADTQKGVREEGGANLGAKVGEYQAVTGAGPGTAWCASFVTWSLEQAGHKMEGGGWAGVATWVQAAREGKNDLQFVSPEEARPGDLVVYDWGGQEDFGADGHIGFVASEVKDGKFTALEGNQGDMVQEVPRAVGQGGANVKFIRVGDGGAPAAPLEPQAAAAPAELGDVGGANPYPGDDAPKEQIAAWMGREAEKRGMPAELPVMAALVESNLANLDHGHSTSLGYFQMLEHLWNKGEYEGYPDKPELQLKWFLDTAEGVMEQRKARGLPIDDPSQYGEWIADTERPAAEYRGRYQLRLDEARGLLEKGGQSSPVAPAAAAAPVAEPAAGSRPPDPSEYGREGSGGPMTPEVKAILENPNVKFDEVGIKDLKEGKIDPRAIAVLTKLSQDHEITVTCMCSDHPRGPGSNHYYGRGVDIGTIDGEIVRPGSAAARELASEIAELGSDLKPTEVGTPFAIASPGYFTDAAHQDHIHIGWDDPISADWKPPAEVAAPVAQVAGVRANALADAAPPVGDSGAFLAVTAETAGRAQSGGVESGAFLAVPASAQAADVDPATVPAGEAPPAAPTGAERIDLSVVADAYPGDDAPKEQLAAWLAKEAEKRGLPPQLPVMAALVESGVRNLNYGDADSVGFFQMRVGIWNRGEYAGFPEKPELQAKWFLDNAEQVKKQRLAAGKSIDDPKEFGEWIADVERPAEQYRYKYQLRLQEADNLLKQATGSAPPAPAAAAVPAAPPVLQAVTPQAAGRSAPSVSASATPPPATPAPPEPAPADKGDSGSFLAVSAEDRAEGGGPSDSGTFLAVEPATPAAEPAASAEPAPFAEAAARSAPAEPFDADLAAIDPDYPGDDAPKEDIARWMAKEAERRGIPPELPVMAALVESNLQNLDHGHSTSLGYFQMLEHFWNRGEYQGYPDNPRLQLKWFLDNAEQVKKARLAAGKSIDDPSEFGEWIADVEKPAAEYRGRYQLRLQEARKLIQ